jgi:hypothetical protein
VAARGSIYLRSSHVPALIETSGIVPGGSSKAHKHRHRSHLDTDLILDLEFPMRDWPYGRLP